MSKNVKLIWDFRGPNSIPTAQHHVKHLKEYSALEQLSLDITGHEVISEFNAIAYMVVTEQEMNRVRSALKPNRGQWYN